MLIEINLAPNELLEEPARRAIGLRTRLPSWNGPLRQLLALLCGLIVIGVLVSGYRRMGVRITHVQAQIQGAVADSIRYAEAVESLQFLRTRQDTIAEKFDLIGRIDSRRYIWSRLMDEVARAVPPYTWLTQINAAASVGGSAGGAHDGRDSAPVFVIQGNAGSTPALTRFMKNLVNSPFIEDVTLITSERMILEGHAVQRFTLQARYLDPPREKFQTAPNSELF